jgi:uncharacterized repeat protein (TIGR01451 family)
MKHLTHNKCINALLIVTIILSLMVIVANPSSAMLQAPQPPQAEALGRGSWVILRTDPRISSHRVPPPQTFLRARTQSATISINYLAGGTKDHFGTDCYTWPNEAKAAFSYAASIWESLVSSPVTIVIHACWAELDPGVLGYGGADNSYRNFPGAPQTDTWYPSALANALYGSDLDVSVPDMHLAYSRVFDWYYGTDGNPGPTESDFASVVLHEICHGLGFSGSMVVDGGLGYWAWGSAAPYDDPAAYDRFIENSSGQSILSFTNGSAALAGQLTSNNLFFDGPNANAANGGSRPKIYTPAEWTPGSSYSHLDYDTFNDTANGLMVWALSAGESMHSPGPVAMGLLTDLGWTTEEPEPAPAVTSITPSSGENTGSVSITNLAGSDFQDGATVKLTKSGQSDINATGVTVVNTNTITCNFNLTGAAAGQWNVVVTNPDAQSGTLTNGFTVTAPPAPDVSIDKQVVGSDFAPGDSITFTLTIANTGNKTASSVIVTDNLPDEVLTPSFDSTLNITPTGAFSYTWNVEPLSEGESGTITINGQIDPSLEDDFSFVNVATISDPEDNTPNNNTSGASAGTFKIYLPIVTKHYPPLPDTPVLNAISNDDYNGDYIVSWNAADGADTYILEEDDNASFSSPKKDSPTSSTSKSITGQADGTTA